MKQRGASIAWIPALALVLAIRASATPPAPTLDGGWRGTLEVGRTHGTSAAAAALTQSGGSVHGTITLAGTDASGTVTVSGTVQRAHAHLTGTLGGRRVRWKAHWARGRQAWRGPLVMQGSGHGMRGMLGFARGDGGALPACGADFFASDVMPAVFATNCVQCHVAGGLAQNTRLRVTPGDPAATALSALGLVDPADPAHSLLVMKPSGEMPHGGGRRFDAGSAADLALRHWVELVTTPGCGGGTGGGGGTGDPYTDNCASCHGADARGVQGYPDIHCSRNIQDAVRNGRSGGALQMPAFPTMSDVDVATIQTFLAGLCPASAVTGSDLFAGNCLSCHGIDAGGGATAPAVRCATRVSDALARGRGAAMPSFTVLVDPEVVLLEIYLDGLCTQHGRTATDLYAGNCATCHGADARGAQNGLGVQGPDIRCNRAIHDPVRAGNGDMPAFALLSDADIASVQTYLGTSCPVGGATGADLYGSNCAVCHGSDARGVGGKPNVRCNRSIHDVVRSGRTGATGTMPAFATMSDAEIGLVQGYLGGLCPAGTASGTDLYAGNCLTCHGTDAGGSGNAPGVRCATRVSDALALGRGAAMPDFPALVGADLASLTTYLGQLCAQHGRTGMDLYTGNCASCHGADGRGAQNGLGVLGPDIRCDRGIHDPVRAGNGNMPAFPGLSDADIASVQQYLGTSFCPAGTATGADLYTSNCAVCHGNDARGVGGNPNVRCNRSIHDVVRSGRTGTIGTMPAFAAMSDAEIGLVQGYLGGLCPAGTASGTDLYAGNCLTCHGTDAGGSGSAPSVRCATRVSDALARGRGAAMPAFPGFPGADLTTLDAYLDQLCTQYGRTGMDLYAGNCATCHGATARGGRNGLGVRGPGIQCTGANDYLDAVRSGEDSMPAFPLLGTSDVNAIAAFVRGTYCPGG